MLALERLQFLGQAAPAMAIRGDATDWRGPTKVMLCAHEKTAEFSSLFSKAPVFVLLGYNQWSAWGAD